MIANGSQFAGTGPIARAHAHPGSFPPKAKDERRKTKDERRLKGNYRAKGYQVFRGVWRSTRAKEDAEERRWQGGERRGAAAATDATAGQEGKPGSV